MSTETELAWAAGFFDGEGSVGIYRRTQYRNGRKFYSWRVTASLSGCHQTSVEKFAAIVGGTVYLNKKKTTGGMRVWTWQAYNRHVEDCLAILLPHLVVKKEQVELAIQFRATVVNTHNQCGTPPEVTEKQDRMAASMKALKLVS